MRLASFLSEGRPGYGLIVGDRVRELSGRLGPAFPDVIEAIGTGEVPGVPISGTEADVPLSDVTLALPVPRTAKIICVGRNYREHVAEAGLGLPANPTIFLRSIDSFAPAGAALVRPRASDQLDFEGELAVVVGRPGRHIARDAALRHVLGYTCLNDGSVRDYQFTHSLAAGKNFFQSGSIGPWIVTSDEIPDPTSLVLRTRLNKIEVQLAKLDDLIFDIPTIISHVSTVFPLDVGDVIATGTPEGVGFARRPPVWLKAGDELEVEISMIGVLSNTVIDEQAARDR